MQKKQQKLAQNISEFRDSFSEYSTLRGEALSRDRFAAYDAGTMRSRDEKLFKQQLKEALI